MNEYPRIVARICGACMIMDGLVGGVMAFFPNHELDFLMIVCSFFFSRTLINLSHFFLILQSFPSPPLIKGLLDAPYKIHVGS